MKNLQICKIQGYLISCNLITVRKVTIIYIYIFSGAHHPAYTCMRAGRDTQFVFALNLMISRRARWALACSPPVALTRRASHKLRRTSVPFTKPSLDESNRLITICLPCAEFHSPVYVRWAVLSRRGIMWDKLYARKSFHREPRVRKKTRRRVLNCEIIRLRVTDLRNNCCDNKAAIFSCEAELDIPLLSGFVENREFYQSCLL